MPVETPASLTLVSCEGLGGKEQNEQLLKDLRTSKINAITYKTGLESIEARLLVYKKNESVYEEDIKVLKREIYLREVAITQLRRKLELAQKQKDEIQLTVENFKNSSKNLRKLLDCQILDKCKIDLGYNAVPLPYTRNFLPLKPNLFGLKEFVNEPIVSESTVKKPIVETSEAKPSAKKPKVVKKIFGPPLIKDWISYSKDEAELKPKIEKKTVKPSFAKIEFVKSKELIFAGEAQQIWLSLILDKKMIKYELSNDIPKQNDKPAKRPVKYAEMYRIQRPRGNQRNWNNLKSHQLGCNFAMYNKACYACGSFNHLQARCKYLQREIMGTCPILQIMSKLMEDILPLEVTPKEGKSQAEGKSCKRLPSKLFKNSQDYVACQKGKQHKASYHKVKVIRCDNGTEFKNREMNLFCEVKGKAKMETIPSKYYILLPLWTVNPLISQESKSSQDDGFQPSSDDRKKVDEDLRPESECKDQEKEDNVNNTNNVNVAGTNKVNVVGAYINKELPFDPEMYELEDISTFTFLNKDENDDAEADMNNLDTTIQVSPTLTPRILKDHPLDQMDVKSAFLYGKIEKEVYFCQPPGFEDLDFLDKVYKVKKVLYGLHKGPRAWRTYILPRIASETENVSTSMETQKPLLKDEVKEEVDVHMYRSMIGSLMYLTSLRPDIMFAACACARYQVNPKVSHLYAVKRIFRYLKGHPKLGLWYPKDSSFDLLAYTDSYYAGASLDRKSITGVNAADMPYYCQLKVNAARHTLTTADFWTTVKTKTVNREVQLQDVVDEKKGRKDFYGRVTSLFPTMMVQAQEEMGKDKAINEEMYDSLERAATTTTSLDAKQDRGTIFKTQSKATPNEPGSQGTSLGGGLGCQETIGDAVAQTRRVKKLEKRKRSRTHGLNRLYKVRLSTRVESSEDEDIFGVNDDEVIVKDAEILFDVADALKGEEVFVLQEVPLNKDQLMLDEELAFKLQAEEEEKEEKRIARENAQHIKEVNIAWDDVQAKIDANYELAQRLQAEEQDELTDAEKAKLFMEFLEKRRKARTKLEQERSKKQKVKDDKVFEELKKCLEIIPDDGDDVTINATPLSFKSLIIVDYKIYQEGKKSYFQNFSADGNSQIYLTFSKMLKNFNREDLEVLWRLVNDRFKKVKLVNHMDSFLLHNLKIMFEHHVEDNIWKNQQGLAKVKNWKLYDSCRVHFVTMQNILCEWGYAGYGIDHYTYSCDELALIHHIFLAGYGVLLLHDLEVTAAKVHVNAAKLNLVLFSEWGYAGYGIDHYTYSCDELALIHHIFLAGYGVL
nr:hypothetical protein [Tanacetum cinerariifolium]